MQTVPYLSSSPTGFPLLRTGFSPRTVHVDFEAIEKHVFITISGSLPHENQVFYKDGCLLVYSTV